MTSLKRFYQSVTLARSGAEPLPLTLELDGKPVRTPARRVLMIAHPRLAEAVVQEWRAQGLKVELSTMPMTRLTMTVNDHVAPRLAEVHEEALAYGRTDLLCYRAAGPPKLIERQSAAWQPYLDWAAEALGARLSCTADLKPIAQDGAALDALRSAIAAYDPYYTLVLHVLMAKYGSLVLALAVLRGRAAASDALAVSRADEIFQAEIWGADWEAEQRAAGIAREVEEMARFLALLD